MAEPIWVNMKGLTVDLSKCKVYFKCKMTPKEWSSLQRAVLSTEAAKNFSIKKERASSTILFISNKLILVV